MNERIVHDIKITETEDGFRIEIRGDKEILRRWIDRAGAFFAGMSGRGHHHEHFREHGPFGRPGPGRDERDALRDQMHDWRQQAREWQREWRHHLHEWRRHGGPFGWNISPEDRDAWVRQAQEWRDQFERQFKGEGPFGPESGRRPFPWYGRREKRKRNSYDLGPWWDEGEAAEDLPTI